MEYYNSNVIMSIGKSANILAVDPIGLVTNFTMRMDCHICPFSEFVDSTPIIFRKIVLIFLKTGRKKEPPY